MAKVLVLYYSSYGHIETMASAIAEGARSAGADVSVKVLLSDVKLKALATQFGGMMGGKP